MSRLLILGASTLQLPAILKAKEMGHYVAVADYNPQAIGILFADEFFPASTIDIEAICQVAETFHPDGIMTLATDMPMRSKRYRSHLMRSLLSCKIVTRRNRRCSSPYMPTRPCLTKRL